MRLVWWLCCVWCAYFYTKQSIKFKEVFNVNIALIDGETVSRDELNQHIYELYKHFNNLEAVEKVRR